MFDSIGKKIFLGVLAVAFLGLFIFYKVDTSEDGVIRNIEKELEQKDYDKALTWTKRALADYPDSQKLKDLKIRIILAMTDDDVDADRFFTAMSRLEEYHQATGWEEFAQKMTELEEKATLVQKNWKLKKTIEEKLGSNFYRSLFWEITPQVREQRDVMEVEDLECGYFLPMGENAAWEECIALLEDYVQKLRENGLNKYMPEMERSHYFNYWEACDYLRRLYLNIGDLNQAARLWKANPEDEKIGIAYGMEEKETGVPLTADGRLDTRKLIEEQFKEKPDYKKTFDACGRLVRFEKRKKYQALNDAGIIVTRTGLFLQADLTYEGNHVAEMRLTNLSEVEIRRYYYDESGRLEEVAVTKAKISEPEEEKLHSILHFSYCDKGIIRGDLDIFDQESGEVTNYASAFAVNEFGDLRELKLSGDRMPERKPGRRHPE